MLWYQHVRQSMDDSAVCLYPELWPIVASDPIRPSGHGVANPHISARLRFAPTPTSQCVYDLTGELLPVLLEELRSSFMAPLPQDSGETMKPRAKG